MCSSDRTPECARADMVVVSYRALKAQTASGKMLWEDLAQAGVFTADEFNAVIR